MRPRNGVFGSLSGGIILIFLALAFALHGFFLPLLFVGLAFSILFGSFSSMNPKGIYGGLHGFIWMLGLAFCFVVGFWPWILLVTGVSVVLGALAGPIMAALAGMAFLGASRMAQQSPPVYQQPYRPEQPYQQSYQPAPPPSPPDTPQTYQEGGRQYPYPQAPYEQPQSQYPQEMPPQQ